VVLSETTAAVHRLIAGGFEWNITFFAAAVAGGLEHGGFYRVFSAVSSVSLLSVEFIFALVLFHDGFLQFTV